MIRILRPGRAPGLLTADAFEALFQRHLGGAFSVANVPLAEWFASFLGPPENPASLDRATDAFRDAVGSADFLCPTYEGIPLAPLLAALRNRSGARVRMLLIAHASGAYAMEWALLSPLLAPGDIVIAPSQSARRTIEFLCAPLAPYVRVIPHPMAPLRPSPTTRPERRVVSLGRIHPGKLLHRQIDAFAVLRDRGYDLPVLEMAGSLDEGGFNGLSPYARSLRQRIIRLGLGEVVRLTGPVRGEADKAAFLSGAEAMLNLSATVEESFPKAPVEALGLGVPVLGTAWDGLHDSVGDAGLLLPLARVGGGLGMIDIDAETVADGIERLLANPPSPERCLSHAASFAPKVIVPLYRRALMEALEHAAEAETPAWPDATLPAAPAGGVLAHAPPLTHMSWRDAFSWHFRSAANQLAAWLGPAPPPDVAGRLRSLVQAAVTAPLQDFLGGLTSRRTPNAFTSAVLPVTDPVAPDRALTEDGLLDRLAQAAKGPGLPGGRLACSTVLATSGRWALLNETLAAAEGLAGPTLDALRARAAVAEGRPDDAFLLLESALRECAAIETEASRMREIARVAREGEHPARVLPWLRDWLGRYPDAPGSGAVWLELTITAARSGAPFRNEATRSLQCAQALLGEHSAIERLQRSLAAEYAADILAPRPA